MLSNIRFLSAQPSWESNTTLVSFIFFSAVVHHLKYKAFEIIKVIQSELGAGRLCCLVIKMFSNCPMLVENLILRIHVGKVVLQALDGPELVESIWAIYVLGSKCQLHAVELHCGVIRIILLQIPNESSDFVHLTQKAVNIALQDGTLLDRGQTTWFDDVLKLL